MRNHTKAASGFAVLFGVLIIGSITLATSVSLLNIGSDSQKESLIILQSAQARALAAACGEEALEQIQSNSTFTGNGNLSLGQGSCTYTITSSGGGNRTIETTANVGQAVRKTQAYVTIGNNISVTSWQDIP